jgi:hypothetical protein
MKGLSATMVARPAEQKALADVDRPVDQIVAFDLAVGVGEFNLAGEVVLVVQAATAHDTAADEPLANVL